MRCYMGSRVLLGLWSVPLYSDFGRVLACKIGGAKVLLICCRRLFLSYFFLFSPFLPKESHGNKSEI